MAEKKCLYIHGTGGTPNYSAEDDRAVLAAVFGGRNFESIAPGIGSIGRGHGVLSWTAMLVTANGTPNNQVFVAPGSACVRGTSVNDQGVYLCPNDGTETLTVSAAHATLDRRDLVLARVKDNEVGIAGDVWELEILAGTAGSGTDPTVPEDTLPIARLMVRDATEAGGTIIRPQDIIDLRPHARATGGITPVAVRADWISPLPFEFIYDRSTDELLMRNEANDGWQVVGLDLSAPWQSYTPALPAGHSEGGTGVVRAGQYSKMGRTVVFSARWSCGSTGNVSAGTNVSIGLPPHTPEHGSDQRYPCAGRANHPSLGQFAAAGIISNQLTGFATNFAYFSGIFDATGPVNPGSPGDGNTTYECLGAYQATS